MPDTQPGATRDRAGLVGPRDGWLAEEMRTVERIRFHRPRVRRERPWHEVLPPGPRDPNVVRAKAVARTVAETAQATAKRWGDR